MSKPHLLILGAGPAGLGAAFQLTRRSLAQVTVLERNSWVGGNAASFALAGINVDYGSHRLHPTCDPEVLRDIHTLLGDDLLLRPRHGRIHLHGRWIHFPLRPLDLVLRLPPRFALNVAVDLLDKAARWRPRPSGTETFASVLEAGLGRTICRDFYFPYARKIWAVPPEELATMQAHRRVGANSLGKMARKLLTAVPGLKPPGAGRFYYPRQGYGQISQAMLRAAEAAGAQVELAAVVRSVDRIGTRVQGVTYERQGASYRLEADYLWSTLPLTVLIQCLQPQAPDEVLEATQGIAYRAMILVYLVLEQEHFSEYDAHYFPDSDIPISRLSEPKNYSGTGSQGLTVLCAELPCAPTDPAWQMSDDDLAGLVCTSLERANLPVQAAIKEVVTKRLRHAYPIYRQGYERHFDRLDHYVSGLANVLTFGRQGLFAHDNTHHALYMAYCAVNCLDANGSFDRERWQAFRRNFETHVVED